MNEVVDIRREKDNRKEIAQADVFSYPSTLFLINRAQQTQQLPFRYFKNESNLEEKDERATQHMLNYREGGVRPPRIMMT